MRRRLVALSTLVAAIAVAGCAGDTSREDFEAQVRQSRDQTDAALEHVTRADTYDELLERLHAAGDVARDAGDDVADTGAPSELEEAGAELSEALRALGDEIRATAEALDDDRFEGSTIQGLDFENWNRVQDALGDLREQGIDVPPLERH